MPKKTQNKAKRQKVDFKLAGLSQLGGQAEGLVEPFRELHNQLCIKALDLGAEDIYICNQMRGFLEQPNPVKISHIIGFLFIGLAVLLDLMEPVFHLIGLVPGLDIINVGVSIFTTFILIWWLGPVGLLFGAEIVIDFVNFIPVVGDIAGFLGWFPTSLVILVLWFMFFRTMGHLTTDGEEEEAPVETSNRCRVHH